MQQKEPQEPYLCSKFGLRMCCGKPPILSFVQRILHDACPLTAVPPGVRRGWCKRLQRLPSSLLLLQGASKGGALTQIPDHTPL